MIRTHPATGEPAIYAGGFAVYPEDQRRHMHRTTVKGDAPYFSTQSRNSKITTLSRN
jgi:alpha-ketoglutarate-dependent taurine dioxygenase